MTENINLPKVLFLYNQDGKPAINVQAGENTLWLSQKQIAELFETNVPNINEHIKNIYSSGELAENTTIRDFRIVVNRGFRGEVEEPILHYNLDMIISIGYRVKSYRGVQFRIWATQVLKEYLIKGFALNDDLLKNAGGGNYFDELLSRIRDIRSSEKLFYRKVLEIYALSIDYDPRTEITKQFFSTVQNKMHFSVHGNTAAEVIYNRANAEKDFMGLTNWTGMLPKKSDAEYAKNYLTKDELDILNSIVNLFLDFAELQAKSHTPLYMKDWIHKLDDFLKLSGKELLNHAGTISSEVAKLKADTEYDKFKRRSIERLSPVEIHFIENFENERKKLKK